jgi:hypothetical protein
MSDEVTFQLNSVEANWLHQQREFCGEAMVEILTGALLEWIARNSDRLIDQENAMVVVERFRMGALAVRLFPYEIGKQGQCGSCISRGSSQLRPAVNSGDEPNCQSR